MTDSVKVAEIRDSDCSGKKQKNRESTETRKAKDSESFNCDVSINNFELRNAAEVLVKIRQVRIYIVYGTINRISFSFR